MCYAVGNGIKSIARRSFHNMMYKLLSKSGAIKNCRRSEAEVLVASSNWQDITDYDKKEKDHGRQPIFIHERVKAEKSQHERDQWENRRLCGSTSSKRELAVGSSKNKAERNEEGHGEKRLRHEKPQVVKASAEQPVKRKRGRPRKYG